MSASRREGFLDYLEAGRSFVTPAISVQERVRLENLLLIARQNAKANDHVVVELRDVPTTKGLQENIHYFGLDVDVELERILEDNVPEPLIDGPYSEELEACDCGRPKSCSCAHFYYP